MAKVWVYADVSPDGKPHPVALELLTKARDLGDEVALPAARPQPLEGGAHRTLGDRPCDPQLVYLVGRLDQPDPVHQLGRVDQSVLRQTASEGEVPARREEMRVTLDADQLPYSITGFISHLE